jgi:hypothetical protein
LPVARYERVYVDQHPDALGHAVGRACHGDAAVAMSTQDNVAKVLHLEHRDNIIDVRMNADVRRREMRALAHAGQRGTEHLMATPAKPTGDRRPLPRTSKATMHDDERCDARSLPQPPARERLRDPATAALDDKP